MPEVGGRSFDYSKSGRAKAKAFAKRTGKTVKSSRPAARASVPSRRKRSK